MPGGTSLAYNALTIDVVLGHYPVKSIREITFGLFSIGPWGKKFVTVAGRELSLDDIHGSNGSSPESLASIVDQYRFLLARLGDDSLKAVVAGTLKGESHEQMALKLGVTERTIRRKLQVVRSIWRTELNG